MIRWLALVWLLVFIGCVGLYVAVAVESAPQRALQAHLRAAEDAESCGKWGEACLAYQRAIDSVPPANREMCWKLRLALINQQIKDGGRPEAIQCLRRLLDEAVAVAPDSELARVVRATLAAAAYHNACNMRKEQAAREHWLPDAELARQQFQLLAERGEAAGDPATNDYKKGLQQVIELTRMDPNQVDGLPFPGHPAEDCTTKTLKSRESDGKSQPQAEQGTPPDAREDLKHQRKTNVASGKTGSSS
jgi:hypothetical protein